MKNLSHNFQLLLFTICISCALWGCNSRQSKNINEYSVAAVLYQQQSGEYIGLANQAYQIAGLRMDTAVLHQHEKDLAVITDLDETALDNSMQQAQLILDDSAYTSNSWKNWVNGEKAMAVPGALAFFKHIDSLKAWVGKQKSHRVSIFYITNRGQSDLVHTMNNMKALGFPQVTAGHFKMFSDGGNKQKRRDSVMAQYHVVLQLGDDLNDFSGDFFNKSYQDRKHIADSLRKHFGNDFILLPNAMYGGWQTGLYSDFKTTNQDSVRHILLKGYK